MEITTGGPDTHDDPLETGGARTTARPLFVQKKKKKKLYVSKFSQFLINRPGVAGAVPQSPLLLIHSFNN